MNNEPVFLLFTQFLGPFDGDSCTSIMFLTFKVPLLSFIAKCLLSDTNSFEGDTLIIRRGTFASKFATDVSKLIAPVANCSEQTANQNTNIAPENWKVARKEHLVLL